MKSKRYSLEDVRRSYTPQKRWSEMEGDFWSFAVYRPLSILITPPFIALGFSAMAVTVLSAFLALSLPFVAAIGGPKGCVAVGLIVFLIHVLDCVDGNIARVTETSSKFGALLDGFVDLCFWSLHLLALGILTVPDAPLWLKPHAVAISVGLGLLVLLHRNLRDSYSEVFAERVEFRQSAPSKLKAFDVVRMIFISLERMYCVALVIGGLTHTLTYVFLAIAAYVVTIFLLAVFITLRQAWQKQRAA